MEAETELIALRSDIASGADAVGSRASTIVDAFYEELRVAYSPGSPGGAPTSSSSRRNQQRLYLDEGRRAAAACASRRHLDAHPDWLLGRGALDDDEIRARVALQHFAAVDIEDLSLPSEDRRSDDAFTEGGVSQQLLLDAGRSDFSLLGEELSFRRELEARGLSLEQDAVEVERVLRVFEERLVKALLRCLGDDAPPALVKAISRSMSQSGMANLERACRGPQIVVSGGEQTLRYELLSPGPGLWEVRSSMRKYDFEQFVIIDGSAAEDGTGKVQVLECGSKSQILRGSQLRFEVRAGTLQVDVRGLVDKVQIVDQSGGPLLLPFQEPKPGVAWKEALSQRLVALGHCWAWRPQLHIISSLLTKAIARCRYCRRRAVGAVESMPGSISIPLQPVAAGMRTVCGTEDPDTVSMRAPLRDAPV